MSPETTLVWYLCSGEVPQFVTPWAESFTETGLIKVYVAWTENGCSDLGFNGTQSDISSDHVPQFTYELWKEVARVRSSLSQNCTKGSLTDGRWSKWLPCFLLGL